MYRSIFVIVAGLVVAGTVRITALQPAANGANAQGTVGRTVNLNPTGSRLPPGARASAVSTIHGNALNSTNAALPNAVVRLRDARFGRIVDTQVTDNAGLFSFTAVDPGSYVVELLGTDRSTVLAASQILNVNAGEAATTIVKLPFQVSPLGGVFGSSTTHAAVITAEAVASGVLATTVAGQPASDRPIR